MGGYFAGFCFYTFAMIGIILIGFVIAKKCMMSNPLARNKDKFLQVENALVIEPKKTIYVIKAGEEKFLIASDAERTSFLTRLNEETSLVQETRPEYHSEPQERQRRTDFDSYIAASAYSSQSPKNTGTKALQSSVMNRILERLK